MDRAACRVWIVITVKMPTTKPSPRSLKLLAYAKNDVLESSCSTVFAKLERYAAVNLNHQQRTSLAMRSGLFVVLASYFSQTKKSHFHSKNIRIPSPRFRTGCLTLLVYATNGVLESSCWSTVFVRLEGSAAPKASPPAADVLGTGRTLVVQLVDSYKEADDRRVAMMYVVECYA